MKITDLALELGVSTYSIKQFIEDFDLELSECLYPNMEVKEDFEKFAKENQKFLRNYEKDLVEEKSTEQIATEINQPVEKVEEIIKKQKPNLFETGTYKSSISSYGIHNQLGGDYHFVYDYFGKKTPLAQRDFIGYRDLYFYITEMLNPFIDEQQAKDWGIVKPAGIILYGPKGSGKIFWARKIAEIIGYEFVEVKNSFLRTSFINGEKTNFTDFISSMMMKKGNELLFLENFHEIARDRNPKETQFSLNEQTKEIILHSIHKFVDEGLLMTVAADNLTGMDSEVFAPGRFDIKIPVFPPNPDERAQMILRYITLNLEKDSTLMKILEFNKADKKPYWKDYASRMKLFSNTMMIDFTQSIKKRLRNQYLKSKTTNLKIDSNILKLSYIECASKLTDEYLNSVMLFIKEVSSNDYDSFTQRIELMKEELKFYQVVEKPRRQIGFVHNEEMEEEESEIEIEQNEEPETDEKKESGKNYS